MAVWSVYLDSRPGLGYSHPHIASRSSLKTTRAGFPCVCHWLSPWCHQGHSYGLKRKVSSFVPTAGLLILSEVTWHSTCRKVLFFLFFALSQPGLVSPSVAALMSALALPKAPLSHYTQSKWLCFLGLLDACFLCPGNSCRTGRTLRSVCRYRPTWLGHASPPSIQQVLWAFPQSWKFTKPWLGSTLP